MNATQHDGYVTDTSYADRFFRELSPAWLNYVAALHGARPRALDRPFAYLELGCGFGTSAVVNAGAFAEGDFHACDFNPVHVDGGRRHAAALGIDNIVFHAASFHELAAAPLPAFDFIVLHGVYSWVGAPARAAVRRLVREKLKPGGLVYASYNCLPGWSAEVPLRRLLVELAASEHGSTAERVEGALGALKRLRDGKLRYFATAPAASAAIESYLKGSSNYLVHEFLNETWEPFYSIDVADELAEAGASYVGSATLADNHGTLVVGDLAADAVASLETSRQRQLALDFAVDRRFRRDVFIGGPAPQSRAAGLGHLQEVVIGRVGRPEHITFQVRVPRGAISFQEDFVHDVRQLMARGSATIGDAVSALAAPGRSAAEIARNLAFLVAAGTLTPFARVHRHATIQAPRRPANAMVERVLADALESSAERAVPSPILGNGVPLGALEALAVREALAGARDVESLTARLASSYGRLRAGRANGGAESPDEDPSPARWRAVAASVLEDLLPGLVRLALVE